MKALSFFWSLFAGLILSIHPLLGTPAVTGLSPDFGPSTGGTSVDITGTGFTGATAVDFGNLPAVSFIVNSDTSITALSPVHTPQVVSITVTTGSGTSPGSNLSSYVYQGQGLAYIANYNSSNVSVINTSSDLVVATVNVGSNPRAVAILPDGTKAYVANNGSSTVSVILASTLTVSSTITVDNFPYALAVTPDGTQVYSVNSNAGTVQAISTATDLVTATTPVGSNPSGIAITPDGTKAYVANGGSDSVSVITTSNNLVLTTINVGNVPSVIAITPDGTKAFVVNNNSSDVSIINTAADSVITTLTAGSNPCAIAITPDGTRAYVANRNSMDLTVIDVSNNSIATTIPVSNFPDAVFVTPDGTKAYAVNNNSGSVSVINTATNAVTATLTVGSNPCAIAITPDSSKAYVTDNTSGNVSVILTANNTVGTITTGSFPEAIAIAPDQAPLAKFSFNSTSSPVTFDASASLSPMGTIANYFWDFGDGSTLNTSSPIAVHSYAASGSYSITLTVTNSAGTSTTKDYDPAFSNDLSFNGAAIARNGGPTAFLTQTISVNVFLLPPTHLRVREVKNKFIDQTDRVNILTWQAPSGGTPPTSYKIYRDASLTKLAGVVYTGHRLKFEDHHRKKGHTYTYYVVSVDALGNQSTPIEATIKDE